MQKIILFLDNALSFLEAYTRILEAKNFKVITASSIEEARLQLQTKRIHLGIFDIRVMDDDDSEDISGLELAKEKEFQYLPKIILTGYPSYEYVRDVLGSKDDSEPAAVNFIGKSEGVSKLLEAIEEAFEKHIRINEKLEIFWESEDLVSFPQLMINSEPLIGDSMLADLSGAYEDLFRKLFYDYKKLMFHQMVWRKEGHSAVRIIVSREIEEEFLITIGNKEYIFLEREKYQKMDTKNRGPFFLSRHLDTQLVSANLWGFSCEKVVDVTNFPDFTLKG